MGKPMTRITLFFTIPTPSPHTFLPQNKSKNSRTSTYKMYNPIKKILAAYGLLIVCGHAHAVAFQPNVTVLSDDIAYDVNADGTFTDVETESIRIDTDQGVKQASQIALRYSKTLQNLTVEDAYTTTPEGKRIDVTPDKILEQQGRESAEAPIFDDGRVKIVVFPAVEIGATLTLRTRRAQLTPLFPGQFSTVEHFRDQRAFKSANVTVRAPAALKLYADAVGMSGGQVASDSADTQTWHWSLGDTPAHAPELGSVSVADVSPRVVVTTFPSFAAAGAAYQQRAAPKAAVTPAIQVLADKLTQGVADPKAQAELLYDWVNTHIRYVAIYLGFGGVVPHDADSVLKAEYGDCKDHVTLLQALLAAKGIRSSPVLVNASNAYWLPKAADPIAAFDHVITYLPDFKLYADSTASGARFGILPFTELGKPALITDNGTGTAEIVTLPVSDADSAREVTTMHVTLDSNGDLNGTAQIDSTGSIELLSREVFASLPPGVESQIAARLLTLTGQSGTGNYHHGDVRDLSQPFVYRTDFQLPGYAQLPGPGAIQVPLGLGGFSNIASTFEAFGAETRDFAVPFPSRHVIETTTITLPDGVKVSHLPQPVHIASAFGDYRSNYVSDGRNIVVTRDLEISIPGGLIQPDQYPELRKMALAVQRDLHRQLVY
jgi:transglutaminase-like putative cysteine protease